MHSDRESDICQERLISLKIAYFVYLYQASVKRQCMIRIS